MLHFPIYLDHNATTPCDARVVEAMLPYFTTYFGNAASHNHSFGWQAEEAVEIAREQVAALIGAESKEIIFTSGATEAANLAIRGVFENYGAKGNHILPPTIEHKAVLDTCRQLEKQGADITYLPVDHEGNVNLKALEAAIKPATILVCIMFANNETGNILPITEMATIAKKHGVLFFTDATQACGKIPVDVEKDHIDLLAMNAHKMYGPKGVGAIYVRRKNPRVKLLPQITGGGHENGLRSGTLNVPGIVGFGKAAEIAMNDMKSNALHTARLRDKLEQALLQLPSVSVNGSTVNRLPQVTNLSFHPVESEGLLMGVNKEIALSSGSACTSASVEPSYVLRQWD